MVESEAEVGIQAHLTGLKAALSVLESAQKDVSEATWKLSLVQAILEKTGTIKPQAATKEAL